MKKIITAVLAWSASLVALENVPKWNVENAFSNPIHFEASGSDAENRPIFVGAQAEIERQLAQMLSSGDLTHVACMIHTPTPTTPLCQLPSLDIDKQLVAPEISADTSRIQTVLDRTITLRALIQSNASIFVIYPAEGLQARSPEQRTIYLNEHSTHDNLYDKPLDETIPAELIGATYLFETPNGQKAMFSISALQANSPSDEKIWTIWLGSLEDPECYERYMLIINWLADQDISFAALRP